MSKHFALRLSLIVLLLAFVGLFVAMPTQVQAQDVATITGAVTDPSGAVIAGVEITLTNAQTGVTYKTVSNAQGSYTITPVRPGPGYKIEFTHEGFKAVSFSDFYMNVDSTRTQNAQMTLGAATETVEVSAASQDVTLNTTDATIGNNVQVQFLNDLPVQDRANPSALFIAQPGVTLDGAVSGARTDQNRVTVDGLDVNDYATGEFGAIVGNAPVDSIQEFRGVAAGDLSSEAGGGGGQYSLVTKSGTNTFHGALFEYHRDTAFEANDWFNNNSNPTVPRPPLIRNQFGGNVGGPILKNKLFFFFEYNSRRDRLTAIPDRTVPLDSFRNGILSYVDNTNNISTLSSAQVASMDPEGIGFNQSIFGSSGLFSSRYPHANDFSGAAGDLINTAGYRFNAPEPLTLNNYVTRVDYTLNDKMKLFGRMTIARETATESSIWFPGDPLTAPFFDKSYAWVVGHDWTISNTKINQFSYGEVYEDYNFPNTYNPTGATQYGGFGGNGSGGTILSGPYRSAINAQGRTYPVPVVRDDFTWEHNTHSFRMGGTFKWPKPGGYTILNYDSPLIGLGGNLKGLDPTLEPANICPSSSSVCGYAPGIYDAAFTFALAPYTEVNSTFNYDSQGNVLPQGSGQNRTYKYYETELYFGDTWRVRSNLTLSYGVRWINYSVPYEVHGIESVEDYGFNPYFQARLAQSAAGQSGDLSVPLISYSLGGKANHAPGYFQPQYKNFGPRIALAYSLNPKTVFHAGAGIVYDQTVINAVQYQESQYDYLFQTSLTNLFGDPTFTPKQNLQVLPRFSGLSTPPTPPTAPTITKPYFPFVLGSGSSAQPIGLANGLAFNETIDNHLKTPYSIELNFGVEHQIPGNFILKASYVGRLGRRLLAQADANQLLEFPDTLSGQTMSAAFANITQQMRSGGDPLNPIPQPWFEDVIPLPPGYSLLYFGVPSNTAILTYYLNTLVNRGDFADSMQALAGAQLLPSNVGMGSQFSENTFYTNMGSSAYHGLLVTLHKNAGHGLQFDLNYTWSHSVDNVSVIANAPAIGGYGFICDVLRPRECRSNSDFDVTHYFNGNFIYDLPVGRGRAFASTSPRWLDEVIGGWKVSGLPAWHSGNAYFMASNAFVAGYANDAPAILVGSSSDVKTHLTGGHGQPLYAFPNPTQANSDFIGPVGFAIGARNNLRGPGFFDLDLGLAKSFPVYGDRVAMKFRADAFNALNHPNFNPPCTDITNVSCPFGAVQSMQGTSIRNAGPASRVLQLALRLEF